MMGRVLTLSLALLGLAGCAGTSGKPAPGELILIGTDNKIVRKGASSDPGAVVSEAKRLGQIEKDRRQGPGGERLHIY